MRSRAKDFLVSLREIIAPARCIHCLAEDTWHCRACRENFRSYKLSCVVCGEDQPQGLTCSDCRGETFLHGVVSAGSYQNPSLRRGIQWLKFKGVRDLATPLARLLVNQLDAIAPLELLTKHAILVPIPLHKQRLRRRGFNQSEDIANAIKQQTGIPVADLLNRKKATFTQSNLPNHLRKQNAAEAFMMRNEPIPSEVRSLILIDDVTTTGSTLSAAAEALQNTGKQIWAATIARG